MKTTLVIVAALLAVSTSLATGADARSKRHHRAHDTGTYESHAPVKHRGSRVYESHDTVRANSADPTHQYKLPDWARAAFESGRRR